MSSTSRPRVIVIGGGLAGLAATEALARHGCFVSLFESRPRLGGRASSITDNVTGETIDNCQHVSMGCCTAFRAFAERLGFDSLFLEQSELNFVAPPSTGNPSGVQSPPRVVAFKECGLPAPAHLSMALWRMPWFSLVEKLQIARAMRALARESAAADEPFSDWLTRHGQNETVQRRFWHLVLVSALSETLDRISLKYARKVFVDGFLKHRAGWRVWIPLNPLDDIYENRIRRQLVDQRVEVRLSAGVERVQVSENQAVKVVLRNGEEFHADEFVVTVPHNLLGRLLPADVVSHPQLAGVQKLESAPIASVHLWYDRPLTTLPHAVFVDRLSQWMFNRSRLVEMSPFPPRPAYSEAPPMPEYLQVVISAAQDLRSRSEADIVAQVDRELREVWPNTNSVLLHGRMLTEHRAVTAPLPGIDNLRPGQQSPIPNLQLAGDWTSTGWPSTMEGAVRSGWLAASNVLARHGQRVQLVPDELPSSWMYRWLFAR